MNFLPWILAGGAAYLISKNYGKTTLKKISVRPTGARLSFSGLKVNFDAFNPTPLKVKVLGITGEIFYKGKSIADFQNLDERILNPGNNSLSVTITPNSGMLNLFKKQSGKFSLSVKYSVQTSLYTLTDAKEISL
jgi:hypothetical protein